MQAVCHPCCRIDFAAHHVIAALSQIQQPPVVAPIAERIDHRGKVRLLLQIGIPLCQRVAQNLRAQSRCLLLVSDAEICRQLRFHGILAQDRLAKSMHGGDLRQIHPRHLPLQMAVIRLLRQLLRDPRGNFAAQL